MPHSHPIFDGGESPLAAHAGAETASFQPATGAAQSDGGAAPKPPAEAAPPPSAKPKTEDAGGLAEGSGIMRPRS